MDNFWKTVVLVASILICSCTSQSHRSASGAMQHSTGVLETLPHSSQYSCLASCDLHPRCKSVSFHPPTLQCQLLDFVDKDKTTEKKALKLDISKWTDLVSGSCRRSSCETGQQCMVDRLNRPLCFVPENCPKVEPPAHSSVEYYTSKMKQYARLRCHANYIACDSLRPVACLNNGSWERWSLTCNRNTWIRPELYFKEKIPCPLTIGSFATVIAKLKVNGITGSLQVSFHANGHESPILRIDVVFIIRHTLNYTSVQYQLEEELGESKSFTDYMPPTESVQLNLTVLVAETHFSVLLGGPQRLAAKHRAPVSEADLIVIMSDLPVASVKITYPHSWNDN